MVVVVVIVVVVVTVVVVFGAALVGTVVVVVGLAAIDELVGEVEEGGRVARATTLVEVDDDVAAPFAECVVNPPLIA